MIINGDIIFFASPAEFRSWLDKNHSTSRELWAGFYKKSSAKPSMTWPKSVDQALCYGWIDGIRKSIDAERYTIRFTPRNPKSVWSAVNIKRVGELIASGLMQPSGLEVFNKRDEKKVELYSFENSNVTFDEHYLAKFKENEKAWDFFKSQPPSYRKTATWWVISPKQEKTRLKRLEILINDSGSNLRIAPLRRLPEPKKGE
jgi:uncharacterized protein YdeI (YjbR/CyaY-like superfamily)